MDLPRYDPSKTYRWNYDHPPSPVQIDVPPVAGEWRFAGLPVNSPLGIPAGPLLNGKWCLYYASLGFDVLTYKTVRSAARECYPLPNLLPVDCVQLTGREPSVPSRATMRGSWAASFGMPSAAPDVWRRDIEWTRQRLPADKLLSVSVVGTMQNGWSIDELANDYAMCAVWAAQSGANCIEVNLSCPNVTTCDGQLYQIPEYAAVVVRCVREAIGKTPLLAKIGHMIAPAEASRLLDTVEPWIDGLAMTNSVATLVTTRDGFAFDGQRRGICGQAIRQASLHQVRMFSHLIRQRGYRLTVVACGGVETAEHVRQYLDVGASAIHMATATMIDPQVGLQIKRRQLVVTPARH